MSSIIAYSQVVEAVLSKEAWDETYFSLLSLKSHLQSLPGWQRIDIWAQEKSSEDVNVLVVTNWDFPEQLSSWVEYGVSVDAILRAMQPPPRSVNVNYFEEIG